MWKPFRNGRQTSPTSTLRHHFKTEHPGVWESECCRLSVPRKSPRAWAFCQDSEPFTQEGLMIRIQEFIANSHNVRLRLFLASLELLTRSYTQSIDLVESPCFRDLLLYLGQGRVTDDDIPKRTDLMENVAKGA